MKKKKKDSKLVGSVSDEGPLKKKKKKMVNITINLPHIYDENIKKLIGMKIVASRSEAIRIALREFLTNELKLYKDLDNDSFKMLIRSTGGNQN